MLVRAQRRPTPGTRRRLNPRELEDPRGDPARLLDDHEVRRVRDRDQGDVGARLQAAALVPGEPDLIVVAEGDDRLDPRRAQARHERAVTVEVFEVPADHSPAEPGVIGGEVGDERLAPCRRNALRHRTWHRLHRDRPREPAEPRDPADAVQAAKRGRLVLPREARRQQQHRAVELTRGGHLERDVAPEAVAADDVGADVVGEPRCERGVVLDAEVHRMRRATEARQRRTDETNGRAVQRGGDVLEDRGAAHAPGEQQHGGRGIPRPPLADVPFLP